MIANLRAWFLGRSRREQWMLLVMAALFLVTALWGLVILPVTDGLASARVRYADSVERLGETQAQLAALKDLGGGTPARFDAPLDAEVRNRAEAAGFALSQDNLQGPGRVQVAIASAKPGALFGWVAGLEEAGFLVDSLKVGDNGDGTVNADLTLAARAG